MEPISIDPAVAAIGSQLVDAASRGLGSAATALPSVTGLAPAGAEEVSAQAATAFAAEGAAMLALNTAAQEELARTGVALTDVVRMYSQVDGEAAGTLGAQLMGAETLPGVGGSGARTPLLANLIDGAPAPNPSTPAPNPSTPVPGPSTTVPAAANAASMALGAGTAPLSSIGSIGQGASAGGAAGPGLASSLAEDQNESDCDDSGDQQPGERLL